jgi:hypothetical protein
MMRIIDRTGKIGNSPPALMLAVGGLFLIALMLVGLTGAWPNVRFRTFTGEIQDSTCVGTAAHVESECALKCVRHGAKWALYDPSREEIYQLDDQEMPGNFAGQQVTIMGTLDKSTKTIHVVKIVPAKNSP